MATLPDTPVNTALTIGALAGLGLIGYTQHLRTKISTQVHENYRAFKAMDTEIVKDGASLSSTDRTIRSA